MEVGQKTIGGRDTNMTKYVCKGVCFLHYRKAPPTGYSQGSRSNRLNPYYDLLQKYCWECDFSYFKEDWSRFRNQAHCNCCGMKMRTRPSCSLNREVHRYD